jgi:hypothetical protein
MLHSPRETTPAPFVVRPSQEFEGNDGKWSTFHISVGSPAQVFRVLVSTTAGGAWIPISPDACTSADPADCGRLRGIENFNGQTSNGFQVNQSSTWSSIGQYSLGVEDQLNMSGVGLFGYDNVLLGLATDQNVSIGHQPVAGIADVNYWLGLVGLGAQPTSFSSSSSPVQSLFVNLRENNQIPSLSFAYTAGAYYRTCPIYPRLESVLANTF